MTEFKTCEEYVLNRVAELEAKVSAYESAIDELSDEIEEYQCQKCDLLEMFKNLGRISRISSCDDYGEYINVSGIWARDFSDYDKLKSVMWPKTHEDEEDEENAG